MARFKGVFKELPLKVTRLADNASKEMADVFKKSSSELAGDMVSLTEKYAGKKGLIGVSAMIGGASVLDMMMGTQDRLRAASNNSRQEREFRQKQEESLSDQYMGIVDPKKYEGLVQEMFNGRIGHSKTWGGRRY
jgi:hypothetical protein